MRTRIKREKKKGRRGEGEDKRRREKQRKGGKEKKRKQRKGGKEERTFILNEDIIQQKRERND